MIYNVANQKNAFSKAEKEQLNNDITNLKNNKADETELNALINRVSAAENNINNKADKSEIPTKESIGLGNVNNTSDIDKPVSTAQATAIADAKKTGTDAQSNLNTHIADTTKHIEMNSFKGIAIGGGDILMSDIAIGHNSYARGAGVALGEDAHAWSGGVAIGDSSRTVGKGVAIGNQAITAIPDNSSNSETVIDAIQIGTGTNTQPDTFQVYNYQLMDANGKIPNERLPELYQIGDIKFTAQKNLNEEWIKCDGERYITKQEYPELQKLLTENNHYKYYMPSDFNIQSSAPYFYFKFIKDLDGFICIIRDYDNSDYKFTVYFYPATSITETIQFAPIGTTIAYTYTLPRRITDIFYLNEELFIAMSPVHSGITATSSTVIIKLSNEVNYSDGDKIWQKEEVYHLSTNEDSFVTSPTGFFYDNNTLIYYDKKTTKLFVYNSNNWVTGGAGLDFVNIMYDNYVSCWLGIQSSGHVYKLLNLLDTSTWECRTELASALGNYSSIVFADKLTAQLYVVITRRVTATNMFAGGQLYITDDLAGAPTNNLLFIEYDKEDISDVLPCYKYCNIISDPDTVVVIGWGQDIIIGKNSGFYTRKAVDWLGYNPNTYVGNHNIYYRFIEEYSTSLNSYIRITNNINTDGTDNTQALIGMDSISQIPNIPTEHSAKYYIKAK